jgi:hypothetical protein
LDEIAANEPAWAHHLLGKNASEEAHYGPCGCCDEHHIGADRVVSMARIGRQIRQQPGR